MEGSFKVARIAGIELRVHFSFLLVLPILAVLFGRVFGQAARLADVPPERLAGAPWLWGLLLAIALFASVLLHELSHALFAIRTGGVVRNITLLMIGGVTQMSEPPKEIRHEAWMAAVGPLTSLLLGGAFLGLHAIAPLYSFNASFALFYLGALNVFLGVFNLLPAFPMDGGRVLRAVLSRRLGLVRATRAAVTVGKGFAILFGLAGFLTFNFFLLLIAFFVWAGAVGEGRQVLMKSLLGQVRVRELMVPAPPPLSGDDTVELAVARMLSERRTALPVVFDGGPIGVLSLRHLGRVEPARRQDTRVREVSRPLEVLSPDADAWTAFRKMAEEDAPLLPVVENGEVVGTLSQQGVVEGLELRQLEAKREERRARRPWHRGPLRV